MSTPSPAAPSLRQALADIAELAKGPLPWDRHEAVVMRTRIVDTARAALAADEGGWRTMDSAPKDHPIWVECDHDADPYFEEDGKRLTVYGAWVEGLSFRPGKSQCVAVWGGGYECDESGEGWGPYTSMSDWWFDAYSEHELPINPIRWREIEWSLPPAPRAAEKT